MLLRVRWTGNMCWMRVISEWSPKGNCEGVAISGNSIPGRGEQKYKRPCGRSILGELEEQHRTEAGAGRGEGGGLDRKSDRWYRLL